MNKIFKTIEAYYLRGLFTGLLTIGIFSVVFIVYEDMCKEDLKQENKSVIKIDCVSSAQLKYRRQCIGILYKDIDVNNLQEVKSYENNYDNLYIWT